MAKSKYGKYIVTELKQNIAVTPWHPAVEPAKKGRGGRVMFLDNEVVPGAFYVDCVWFVPRPEGSTEPGDKVTIGGIKSKGGVEAHEHDYDEVIAFFGTNLENPNDLGAEIELWLGDERHVITKSCLVFVPKGLKHCPLKIKKIDRPVFHFTTGPANIYF
jgi:hypothetical protein